MTSAIAAVSAREGSRVAVGQSLGQPRSYCGQSPCSIQPSRGAVALGRSPVSLERAPGRLTSTATARSSRIRAARSILGGGGGGRAGAGPDQQPRIFSSPPTRACLYSAASSPKSRSGPAGTADFPARGRCAEGVNTMAKPLMAKATAVWLVDNTTLSFKQIADFCGLHELEVQGIADGDVAAGREGLRPDRQQPARADRDRPGREGSRPTGSSSSSTPPPWARRSGAGRATRRCPSGRTGRRRSCGW